MMGSIKDCVGYPDRSLIERNAALRSNKGSWQTASNNSVSTPKTDHNDQAKDHEGSAKVKSTQQPLYHHAGSVYDVQVGSRMYLWSVPSNTDDLGGKK